MKEEGSRNGCETTARLSIKKVGEEQESARSRERHFEYFCARRQFDLRWLEPESQCFLRIAYRFFLAVSSGSAAR
jgi:hypothetical protein